MISKSPVSAARTCLLVMSLTSVVFLGARAAGAVQLTASWVDNAHGTATTRLERRPGSVTAFAAIADVPPGVAEYVDTSISPSTTYCYRVLAYNADGVSPYSDEACATSGSDGSLEVRVSKTGGGTGTVASTPAGIACGTACSAAYPAGTAVTLTATPDAGSTFTGWSGGCAGTGTCTLAGNAPVSVTATFAMATKSITVSKAGDGGGAVASTPAGILCGTVCSATYPTATAVTLTATPAVGSVFAGWSGGCAGTGTCTPAGNASASVTATFTTATKSISVSKAGDGAGTVASAPAGILCGTACSGIFPLATAVTLTATPAAGSMFAGWSGGCAGTGHCIPADGASVAVTATFTAVTRSVTVGKAGDGTGTVASIPAGILCGTACSATYVAGIAVTLTATPAAGSIFTGWSGGGCGGTGTCTLAGDVPVTVTATFIVDISSFADVPPTHPFFAWIEALVPAGLTTGCAMNPPMFCPDAGNTRREMAVFLLRGLHGAGYQPPPATGMFEDVPITDIFAAWIEQLAREGITGGCSASAMRYCPDDVVTRGQMAVFLLRAKHGAAYAPPASAAMYTDVPEPDLFADWISQLAREGITGGCSTSPSQYCPEAPVTRGQMAVFLVRTFNLPM